MSFIKSFFRGGYNSHSGYGGGHGHGSKHGRNEAFYYGMPQQMELPPAKLRTVLTAADLRPQMHGFATIAACPSSLLNAALAINR